MYCVVRLRSFPDMNIPGWQLGTSTSITERHSLACPLAHPPFTCPTTCKSSRKISGLAFCHGVMLILS